MPRAQLFASIANRWRDSRTGFMAEKTYYRNLTSVFAANLIPSEDRFLKLLWVFGGRRRAGVFVIGFGRFVHLLTHLFADLFD